MRYDSTISPDDTVRTRFICESCGVGFWLTPAEIRHERGSFCTRACRDSLTPLERFWVKVDKDRSPFGCWLWTGAREKNGYGSFGVDHKTIRATRFILEQTTVPLLPKDLACHRCESFYPKGDITYRLCVNPDHLYRGTNQSNSDDRWANGRMNPATGDRSGSRLHPERRTKGGSHIRARLTDAQADAVRVMYAQRIDFSITYKTIAAEFGVTEAIIGNVIRGHTYRR